MWCDKIFIDHCAMEGLSSSSNIQGAPVDGCPCFHTQTPQHQYCIEMGWWYLFLSCPHSIYFELQKKQPTPIFYIYHINPFGHGPSQCAMASGQYQGPRFSLDCLIHGFLMGPSWMHGISAHQEVAEISGQGPGVPVQGHGLGFMQGGYGYPWHAETHYVCI